MNDELIAVHGALVAMSSSDEVAASATVLGTPPTAMLTSVALPLPELFTGTLSTALPVQEQTELLEEQ